MSIKQKLKQRAKELEPMIRIGKAGLSNGVIQEIKNQLKKKKMIKIKILRSCLKKKDKKEIAKELAERTNSELIDRVGFMAVLRKKEKYI